MTKLYLVTGFLGSGKTTFLKKFIPVLNSASIHLIINEFGKESIDGSLLRELNTKLTEINNGSIFCTCKLGEFENVLRASVNQNPDYIIVESSGFSNPSILGKLIRNIINETSTILYSGSICLIDSLRFKKVYSTVHCVKQQLAVSDLILINKVDLASEQDIEEIVSLIKLHHNKALVKQTYYATIDPSWLAEIKPSAYTPTKEQITPDLSNQKLTYKVTEQFTLPKLINFLESISNETYRIKGFITIENSIYLVNCVSTSLSVEPYHDSVHATVDVLTILTGINSSIKREIKRWHAENGIFLIPVTD